LGNVRRSILALAALILMVWLLDALPDMAIHGLRLSFDYGGVGSFAHEFIFPTAALAAVALTLKDRQIALAGLLACLPTLFNWVGVVIFIVAVLTHGF
jgi:hypothetical protein